LERTGWAFPHDKHLLRVLIFDFSCSLFACALL
jgi:hypothetical protein